MWTRNQKQAVIGYVNNFWAAKKQGTGAGVNPAGLKWTGAFSRSTNWGKGA
jgi:hypothetical protein